MANSEKDFWDKIDKSGGDESCWPWLMWTDRDGYGDMRYKGRHEKSHRLSYFFTHNKMPLLACHTCDNRNCCNPKHIYNGTPQSNMSDKVNRSRQTKGIHVNTNKHSEEFILNIRDMDKRGMTALEISNETGLQNGYVHRILRRQVWKSI